MTVSDVRTETGATVSPDREGTAPDREGTAPSIQTTQSEHFEGDPRVLFAARVLAASALLVTAIIHARLAFQLGVGGSPIELGQLFFVNAVASLIVAMAMFSRSSRVWLFAVVLSGAGLLGILASIYFPIASVGPLPAIDEPSWLLTKAICAMAEVTVIALWAIRRIAPLSPKE